MTVIYLANVRAARGAKNLAEALSADPVVRAQARSRAIAEINRRERLLLQPRQPAQVVRLDTRMAKLRGALRRMAKSHPEIRS